VSKSSSTNDTTNVMPAKAGIHDLLAHQTPGAAPGFFMAHPLSPVTAKYANAGLGNPSFNAQERHLL
jgi:hypothetical protein